MAQAGIHAMVGIVSRKWMPKREWFLLGAVLGNMFPDLDNLVVAYAALAKLPDPDQYHRTFTHSIFTIIFMALLFYVIAALTRNIKWRNFGVGFGAGILMHVLLDLLIWFNGVPLFWPLGDELNFWAGFVKPPSLDILLNTGEFLMFGLYFLLLGSLARRYGTDAARIPTTTIWAYIEVALFVMFTALFFSIGTQGLIYQVFGALYLT
ncbi:MAG: metal-dependent hydrolase, partial [Anaerolineales bacterium]|nr:metal-dependent hydrolase [Anaerolineales bacterium]